MPHAIENAGISIALPSHFTKSTVQKPPITACLSFLHGKDAVAIVSILPLALQVKSVKEAGEETRKELESVGFKVKDVTASGGLGATSAVEYVNDKQHGLNVVFMLEPGRFVDVQCACPEAVWAECSKEWPKYLQSLKKLPAAK